MRTLVRTNSRWLLVLAAAIAVIGTSVMIGSQVQASHGGTVVCDITGNCYEYVAGPLNWDDAETAAGAMTHNGVTGHLATITSEAETDFVVLNLPDAVFHIAPFVGGAWIGAFQPAGSVEPDGGWEWVTGEAFAYDNWAGGEPNNSGGEDAVHFWQGAGAWNDADGGLLKGYLVEFDAPGETGTKAEILGTSGVEGKGISTAPGLDKEFNPKSKAAGKAGKK